MDFKDMKPLIKRGEKMLHLEDGSASVLNGFINRRDAVIYVTSYRDGQGYNPYYITRMFLCEDNKSDCAGICRQFIKSVNREEVITKEDYWEMDQGFVETLKNLISGNNDYKSAYGNVDLFVNNYYEGE